MAGRARVKKVNEEAARLCKELGCSKLYINTKGEYFTEFTYAVASEGGEKKNVSVYESDSSRDEVFQDDKPEKPVSTKDKKKEGDAEVVEVVKEPESKENDGQD